MTITMKYLRDLENSAFLLISTEQKKTILDRFGTEPAPYVWTDHDIASQIQNYLSRGEFTKAVND